MSKRVRKLTTSRQYVSLASFFIGVYVFIPFGRKGGLCADLCRFWAVLPVFLRDFGRFSPFSQCIPDRFGRFSAFWPFGGSPFRTGEAAAERQGAAKPKVPKIEKNPHADGEFRAGLSCPLPRKKTPPPIFADREGRSEFSKFRIVTNHKHMRENSLTHNLCNILQKQFVCRFGKGAATVWRAV